MSLHSLTAKLLAIAAIPSVLMSCKEKVREDDAKPDFSFAVIAPAHFHASLVQKDMISDADTCVRVFAPDSAGITTYLDFINTYNTRENNPTRWHILTITGNDFLDRFAADTTTNIAVIAGNNRDKTRYIAAAVSAGKNVLADKPLAINGPDYILLDKTMAMATEKGLQVRELMTERYDTVNIAVRHILSDTTRFGTLIPGTPSDPAIYMKSTHHFYKNVSGTALIRPEWYYDVAQQGEGIADVTTHLIDLIMWQAFPDTAITREDVEVTAASHYPTVITPRQFSLSTGADGVFPKYLKPAIRNGNLEVYANGTIEFRLKGINVRIDVKWDLRPPKDQATHSRHIITAPKALLKSSRMLRPVLSRTSFSYRESRPAVYRLTYRLKNVSATRNISAVSHQTSCISCRERKKFRHGKIPIC